MNAAHNFLLWLSIRLSGKHVTQAKKEAYIHARTQFTAPKLLYRDRLKERSLGCVKCAPAASGGQDAGIMQPRDHSLADPCT